MVVVAPVSISAWQVLVRFASVGSCSTFAGDGVLSWLVCRRGRATRQGPGQRAGAGEVLSAYERARAADPSGHRSRERQPLP